MERILTNDSGLVFGKVAASNQNLSPRGTARPNEDVYETKVLQKNYQRKPTVIGQTTVSASL